MACERDDRSFLAVVAEVRSNALAAKSSWNSASEVGSFSWMPTSCVVPNESSRMLNGRLLSSKSDRAGFSHRILRHGDSRGRTKRLAP